MLIAMIFIILYFVISGPFWRVATNISKGVFMHISKKISTFLLAAFVLFMISSHGVSAASSSGGVSGTTPLTLAQLLQETTNMMKHLKSVSYNLNSTTSLTISDLSRTAGNAQTLVMIMMGSGVNALSGDAKGHLSISTDGQNTTINEIVKGQKFYVENQKGQWYVLSKSAIQRSAFASPELINYNGLFALPNVKTVDDSSTTLDGSSVRHVTLKFNKNAISDLLNATGALNSLTASQKQDMSKFLPRVTLKNAVLDMWIDASTAYIHRFQLQFDMSQLMIPTPGTASHALTIESAQTITLNYSKFNAPVTIIAPVNATPTDSILTVLK
jgi:hypothetical protein